MSDNTYGKATVQMLYTLAGVDNPLARPAIERQVEHRSGTLSRRGFMGLTAAGAAGLIAGQVFDPVTKLWTPADPAKALIVPGRERAWDNDDWQVDEPNPLIIQGRRS